MKRMKVMVVAIGILGLAAAGSALAADTATINVTAEVRGTCSFDTASYDMDFGSIDPTGTGDVTASVDLAFTCTNQTDWDLTDESGTKTMDDGLGNTLDYSIDAYTLSGTGDGTTQNVTVTGRISEGDYGSAVAGNYSHSFTIDITP